MNISGTYKTQHGELTIAQNGDNITATYQENGVCSGKLIGNKVEGIWKNKKEQGLFEWTFDDNGNFSGKHNSGIDKETMRGKWDGTLLNASQEGLITLNKSTQDFINYIKSNHSLTSAYDGKIESTTDFVEDFSLEFEDEFFGDLKDVLDVVVFRVDNSEYSIEEMDGRDSYQIFYDFKNNCIYQQDPNQDDEYYCFLQTWHASIPINYKEGKNFLGCYSMSDLNGTWDVDFHGDFESFSGDIDENTINKVKEKINGKTFYAFLKEVLDCI
jgi:hypothetical protein